MADERRLLEAQDASVEVNAKLAEERRSTHLFSVREFFDRIGYGAATPQFINILFWLAHQGNPYVMFFLGLFNGLKTVFSVLWSELMQEYAKLHRVSKNVIATGGVIFGFSFLFMAFGLLLHSITLFALSFIIGTIGVVAYGDLYQSLVQGTIRKERTNIFFRTFAHWGVIITAISLLVAGILLDRYPMAGTPISFTLFGHLFSMTIYGYLVIFEITAFVFIISGYLTSLVRDGREQRQYPFILFLREHTAVVFSKTKTMWRNKYVTYLLIASFLAGIFQLAIAAYSGVAIYRMVAETSATPFFTVAIMYAIAIVASFSGPFFTQRIHRSTGLVPTLVFGTLLMAILPLVLIFNTSIVAITAALCLYLIGAAIVGFGQGLLAKRLMDEELRRSYFQVQAVMVMIPYLIMIPLLAWVANAYPLSILFGITAIGLIALVMPIYFVLVLVSESQPWK